MTRCPFYIFHHNTFNIPSLGSTLSLINTQVFIEGKQMGPWYNLKGGLHRELIQCIN